MDRKPNTNQHEAIAMILDPYPTPPILVIGPFGTGKTFTLSLACVSILKQSGRNKVLICTHSNSAADIHLERLHEEIREKPSLSIRPLRVLNLFRKVQTVPAKLRKYCNIEGKSERFSKRSWEWEGILFFPKVFSKQISGKMCVKSVLAGMSVEWLTLCVFLNATSKSSLTLKLIEWNISIS